MDKSIEGYHEKEDLSLFQLELKTARELLKDIVKALNAVPNTRTPFSRFKDTYGICSAIDTYLRK